MVDNYDDLLTNAKESEKAHVLVETEKLLEAFMENTRDWLDNLKLRVSYGTSGADNISPSLWQSTWKTGTNAAGETIYLPGDMQPNPDLKWETTISRNIGIDYGFLGGRINGALEIYWNTTKDLLMAVPVDNTTGYSYQFQNFGQTSNKGVELSVNAVVVDKKDWKFSVGAIYNYNKNNSEGVIDKKNVEEYAELFVNYKLKVLSALDNRLDTLTSYQKEFRTYRDQLIRPLLVPEGAKEKECKAYYDGMLARLEGKQLLQPAHILIRLPQDATEEQQAIAKAKIDSIHQALKDGADFAELAQTVSQDPGSAARGGMLPWIGPNQVVKEFEDVAYSLEVNEVSEPFLMPFGYDIVKLMGKKDLESYEELHDMIMKYLEGQGLENQLAQQVLDSIASQSNGEKTIEQILKIIDSKNN